MIKDITGQRFGRLLVLYYNGNDKKKNALWMCECKCGTLIIVSGTHLRTGNTQSCGCLQKEKSSRPHGQSIIVRLYHALMHNAKKRDIKFELTKDEVKSLIFSRCYYCGAEPSNLFDKTLLYSGIDRVDNNKGYISGNVVSCCKNCNHSKGDMNSQSFIGWINRISKSSFFLLRKFGGSHSTLIV